MWSPSNRSPRAPSRGALRLFEKFERRQPPSPKRRLSASRRVAKNQCADKGFPIADRRRVRERQFALSCSLRSLVPRAQLPNQQTLGTRGDLRQHAVRVIAVAPPIAPARTRRLVADSLRKSRRDLAVDLRSSPLFASERAFAIAIGGLSKAQRPSRSIAAETLAKTVDQLDRHYRCHGCNPGKCPDTRRMVFASTTGSRDIAHNRYLCISFSARTTQIQPKKPF
jgi:hypothetical protein